jgi:hypothetical protein
MPESIIVHFSEASASEIFPVLAACCERAINRETYFYPSNGTYVLLMSEYLDYEVEYDEEEKTRIEASLGRCPCFSLSIELRRSKQDFACDAAAALVSELSTSRSLIVDDCHRLWSRAEIQAGSDFLQAYRCGEESNQLPQTTRAFGPRV